MIAKIAASALLAVSAFGLVGSPALAGPTPPPPPPPSSDVPAPSSPGGGPSADPGAQAKLQAPSDAAAARIPACGTHEGDHDRKNGRFAGNGVHIRTGPRVTPNPGCTIVGEGNRGQVADYYCWDNGQGGTWTYLRDTATGKVGWVQDSFLSVDPDFPPLRGSLVKCP